MATLAGIGGVLFVAALTQSLTGFGLALVSMPLLSLLIGLPQATALVALVSLVVELTLLRRYWAHLRWRPVLQLIAASLVGVPLGVALLHHLPADGLRRGLGALLLAYSLYALAQRPLPPLPHPAWGWGAGLLAGALGGAYNTSGPPVILYGHARRWAPPEFKANLQAFFLANSTAVFLTHLLAGDITFPLTSIALETLPALVLGLWLGGWLEKYIAPATFRTAVLIVLALIGIRML